MNNYDVIIKNGFVIDGTGKKGEILDIAIKKDKIVKTALKIDDSCEKLIDATGLVVTPGLIDPHCHEETVVLNDGSFDVYLKMGVTTTINGNCGHSVTPGHSANIYEYYYKNGLMTKEGKDRCNEVQKDWTDLASYLKIVEEKKTNINMGFLLGHGTIRWSVMGGSKDRQPTKEESEAMDKIIIDGMRQGAMGLSTGLAYIPSRYSDTEELIRCCKLLKPYNGIYATHGRYYDGMVKSTLEAIGIGRKAEVKVQISHLTPTSPESFDAILKANIEGLKVCADVVPLSAGHCMRKDRLIQFIMAISSTLFDLGVEGVRDALKTLEGRKIVKEEAFIFGNDMDKVLVINTGNPNIENKSIAQITKEQDKDEESESDVLFDLISDEHPYTFWLGGPIREDFPLTPHADNIVNNPYIMVGSDKIFAEPWDPMSWYELQRRGSFPTFMNMYKKLGVSLEEIIRRNTSLVAKQFNIEERGVIKKGMKADIAIFDMDKYSYPLPSEIDYSNSTQVAKGVEYVLVNGTMALERGEVKESRTGEIIKNKVWGGK